MIRPASPDSPDPQRRLGLRQWLVLQILGAGLFCLLAASVLILAKDLAAEQSRLDRISHNAARAMEWNFALHGVGGTPDLLLDWVASRVDPDPDPGACIEVLTPTGAVLRSRCAGWDIPAAPSLFRDLVTPLMRPVLVAPVHGPRGRLRARIRVSADPAMLAATVWRAFSQVALAMLGLGLAIVALVLVALGRTLRRLPGLLSAFAAAASGDPCQRLEVGGPAEIARLARGFNSMAASLEAAAHERASLLRGLLDAQEAERKRIARELHDELGQCLAGIAALAATGALTADGNAQPDLAADFTRLGTIATDMMATLRGTLARLRPPDLANHGIEAALADLVLSWNRRAGGRTRFTLDLASPIGTPAPAIALAIYRIAQEALSNAAKHAGASEVRITLDGGRSVTLTITDDGTGAADAANAGHGLTGIRERVALLGGALTLGAATPPDPALRGAPAARGFSLRVTLPATLPEPLGA